MRRRRLCIALLAASPAVAFPSAVVGDDAATQDGAPTHAGGVILRVEVENTPFYPKSDHECPADLRCIQTVFWARYRARVIEVVAGTWSGPDVEFLHLEHSQYAEELLRDCRVVLRPRGAKLREASRSTG